ncbi:uncharacterized protein LOC131886244 isoform X2 [Tigriopus californicus]|uniref:uncharacterized protein LOC131886244 isoform X2 n=1 Tax=Tigriopus californicus TaxID=6832 RepID=UPI0027D9E35A|nr:uncharacterized protein LOC131886244 isoform X2 [Tigriopus californicus]
MTPRVTTENTSVDTTTTLEFDPDNGCDVQQWGVTLGFQVFFIACIACSLVFLAIMLTFTIRRAMTLRKLLKPEYEPHVDIVDDSSWTVEIEETEDYMKRKKEEMDRFYERAPSPVNFGTLSKAARPTSKSFSTIEEENEEEIDLAEGRRNYQRSGNSLPRLSGHVLGTRSMSSHFLRPPSMEPPGTLYRTQSQEFVESMHKSVLTGEKFDKQFAPRLSNDDRRRSSAESSDKYYKKKKGLDLESGTMRGTAQASMSFSLASYEGQGSRGSSRRNSSSPTRKWEGPSSIFNQRSPSSPNLDNFDKNFNRVKSLDNQGTPILKRVADVIGTLGRNTLQYRAQTDLFGDNGPGVGTSHGNKRETLDDNPEHDAKKYKAQKVKKRSLGDLREFDPTLVQKDRSGSTSSEVLVYNRHRRSGVTFQEASDFEVHL